MTSSGERLVHMATQIARNLQALGEEAAIAATADHIASFWDPRMRARLLATPIDMLPNRIVAEAVELLRQRSTPRHVTLATAVQGGSDAG